MREILVREGHRVTVNVDGLPPARHLIIENERGLLKFHDNGTIVSIAIGRDREEIAKTRAKLRPPAPMTPAMQDDATVHLASNDQAMIFTPKSMYRTCVYLDVLETGLRLVGGGGIIGVIHGGGLIARLEKD